MTKALAKAAKETPPAPADKLTAKKEGGVLTITATAEDYERVKAALGGLETRAQGMVLGQLLDLLSSPTSEDFTVALNIAVEMIEAIAPSNAAEGLLAVQMVAAHMLGMDCSRRALKGDRVDFRNVHASIATKAQRTFLAQIEGLAKLRRNGEQVVRHVHVNEGGQAVFAGTINQGQG